MTTTYTGVPTNVSLASVVQTSIPADGDADNAATFNAHNQKVDDYLEALRGSALAAQMLEGFDGTTFPPSAPSTAWAAPSVNFGSDLAFVRDTTSPLVAPASANRPGSQSTNQNSSMSLAVYLTSPSRITFLFDTLSNQNSDFFDFYIDGTRMLHLSGNGAATPQSGRYYSDVLREGKHVFDWRFTRGGSASIANERARVDGVEVIPESTWLDRTNYFIVDDDFIQADSSSPGALWSSQNSGNAGGVQVSNGAAGNGTGDVAVTCAATAVGDWEAITLAIPVSSQFGANHRPFIESSLFFSFASMFVEFGLWDKSLNNLIAFVADSSLGTTWRMRTSSAGVSTTVDTGITVTGSARLNLTWGCNPPRPEFGANQYPALLGLINGQAVQTGSFAYSIVNANIPYTLSLVPYLRVGSRTAAAAKVVYADYIRGLWSRGPQAF